MAGGRWADARQCSDWRPCDSGLDGEQCWAQRRKRLQDIVTKQRLAMKAEWHRHGRLPNTFVDRAAWWLPVDRPQSAAWDNDDMDAGGPFAPRPTAPRDSRAATPRRQRGVPPDSYTGSPCLKESRVQHRLDRHSRAIQQQRRELRRMEQSTPAPSGRASPSHGGRCSPGMWSRGGEDGRTSALSGRQLQQHAAEAEEPRPSSARKLGPQRRPDNDPDAALVHLVRMGNLAALEDTGAALAARPAARRMALFTAARQGDPCIINYLVADAGCNADWREAGSSRTPLHEAAAAGHPAACSILQELGADPSLEDAGGRTPADVAGAQVAEILAEHGSFVVPGGEIARQLRRRASRQQAASKRIDGDATRGSPALMLSGRLYNRMSPTPTL